jgi:hypothetical protein
MNHNPTTERHMPNCCYCDKPIDTEPFVMFGGLPIHESCLLEYNREVDAMDQHREESPADYEPTDDDWDACLQSYYGYGQGRMSI